MREEDERGEGEGKVYKRMKSTSRVGGRGDRKPAAHLSLLPVTPSIPYPSLLSHSGGREGWRHGSGGRGAWDSSFLPVSISCRLRSNLPPSSYWAYSFGRHEWKGRERGFGPALQSRKINIKKVFLKSQGCFYLCVCVYFSYCPRWRSVGWFVCRRKSLWVWASGSRQGSGPGVTLSTGMHVC